MSVTDRLPDSLCLVTEVLYNNLLNKISMKLFRPIKVCLNPYKVHKDKQLSDSFQIQNSLQKGYALTLLLFNTAVEYVIRSVHRKREDL